jgi:hypothetical protein
LYYIYIKYGALYIIITIIIIYIYMGVLHRFISGSSAINSRPVVTTYIPPPPASESKGSRRPDPFCVRHYVHPTGESVIIIISARAYPPTIIFLLLYILHYQVVLYTTYVLESNGRRDWNIDQRNFLPFTSNFQYPSFSSMFFTRAL